MLRRLRKSASTFKMPKKTLRVGSFRVCPGANTEGGGVRAVFPPAGGALRRKSTELGCQPKPQRDLGGEAPRPHRGYGDLGKDQLPMAGEATVAVGSQPLTSRPQATYLSQELLLPVGVEHKLI